VAPDALRRAGNGFSWTFRDEADWLVLETVRKVTRKLGLNSPQVVLTGFSQGANVALAVALKHPTTFTGVIAISGHYEPWMLPREIASRSPRFFLLTGNRDPAADTFRQADRDLGSRGLKVKLRVFSGAHEVPKDRDQELQRGLKFLQVR
jgi:predicted esterase